MSNFTDPMAALEEAYTVDGIVLETIVPTGGHDIF
jgi:hypothetical protein